MARGGQPRRYRTGTSVVAFRVGDTQRATVEWLALRTGVTLSDYVRRVIEDHLRALGFDVRPGHLEHLPTPDEARAFQTAGFDG
jgi:hypothetical protein